jgi:hypothetical protein
MKKKAVCHWLATFKAKASRLFPTRQRPPESFNSAWGTSNSRNALAIKKQASYGSSDAHVYDVRPRKDHRGFDLISDALPFGRLWYGEPSAVSNAIGYAMQSNSKTYGITRLDTQCSVRKRRFVWRSERAHWGSWFVKYWKIIADRLSQAGWSLGWVSAIDSEGRTIWIVDAHRDNGKRFVVHAEEKLRAFLELQRVTRESFRFPSAE